MRTIWNVLSFMAVVNMLALAGLGIWLWQSGRLSAERARSVKELFVLNLTDAEAAAAAAEAAEQAALADAVLRWEESIPPR